jgi:hypothetical protein
MKMFTGVVRELIGLFVDDGMLAATMIAVTAVAAIVANVVPGMTAGVVLLVGLLFVLFANVMAVGDEDATPSQFRP